MDRRGEPTPRPDIRPAPRGHRRRRQPMDRRRLNRRAVLAVGASTGALGTASLLRSGGGGAAEEMARARGAATPAPAAPEHGVAGHHLDPNEGDVDVEAMGFDPSAFVRAFDYGEATTMADGAVVHRRSEEHTSE